MLPYKKLTQINVYLNKRAKNFILLKENIGKNFCELRAKIS
jgi:hypothetical protein